MQELLLHVFHTIEQANIRYCVLRGYEELDEIEDGGDVDLLVQADQIERFREVLGRLEFVMLPVWGHAPHRFFVGYDQSADRWLKLDVVTTVAFGKPIHAIETNLASSCLDRRYRREPTFVPSPEDELLTLLLHCLLDKAAFAPNRRARIGRDLDQIQLRLASSRHGLVGRHDPQLRAVGPNHANRRNADLLINPL